MMDLRFSNFPKVICSIFLLFSLASNSYAANGVFNVKDFGALGDEKNDDAQAFLSAWKEACNSDIPATVLVPQATYIVSLATFQGPCKAPIVFQLNGVVKAHQGLENLADKENWIVFKYINNLTLTGGGIFHGQGASAWPQNVCSKNSDCKLPISLRLSSLNDSTIEGIQSIDSKFFHINVMGCNNLKLRSINISAPLSSVNTDGIHIGRSNNVEISNSTIGTGDDCVSLGQGSKNINITGVFCGPGHGISVGSLGQYKDEQVIGLTVRNCTFTETDNGLRIKTWPDSNDGVASNFTFVDIVMNNVENPIFVDQQYCPYSKCNPKVPSRIKISNVSFRNILGTSASKVAVTLACSQSFPCENVEIGEINLVYNGTDGPATSQCSNIKPTFVGQQIPPVCV